MLWARWISRFENESVSDSAARRGLSSAKQTARLMYRCTVKPCKNAFALKDEALS